MHPSLVIDASSGFPLGYSRVAKMGIYYEQVQMARPSDRTKEQEPARHAMGIVEIKELGETPQGNNQEENNQNNNNQSDGEQENN